jgi:hypothetical protein
MVWRRLARLVKPGLVKTAVSFAVGVNANIFFWNGCAYFKYIRLATFALNGLFFHGT